MYFFLIQFFIFYLRSIDRHKISKDIESCSKVLISLIQQSEDSRSWQDYTAVILACYIACIETRIARLLKKVRVKFWTFSDDCLLFHDYFVSFFNVEFFSILICLLVSIYNNILLYYSLSTKPILHFTSFLIDDFMIT